MTYRELIRLSGWTQMAEQVERRGVRSTADLHLLRTFQERAREEAAAQSRVLASREDA